MKKLGNLCVILIINKSILLYTIIVVGSPNLYIINSNRGIRFKKQDFILKSVSIFKYWASRNARHKCVASCPARAHILSACYLTCKPKLIILYRWSATETYRSIFQFIRKVSEARTGEATTSSVLFASQASGEWQLRPPLLRTATLQCPQNVTSQSCLFYRNEFLAIFSSFF